MTRDEIKESVIDLMAELLAEKSFDRNMLEYLDLVDDVGMDSITFITLIVEIEAKFNMTVLDDLLSIENFKNVDNIITVIEMGVAKGAERHNGR